jgi:hypothetical protein
MRPEKNNSDWFKHDSDMRNHRKVKVLRNKYGMVDGYAFWSMMLEYLSELCGNRLENTSLEVEMFSAELGMSSEKVMDMINFSTSLGLLQQTPDGLIYSPSLDDRLSTMYEKRNRERKRATVKKRDTSGVFVSDNSTGDEIPSAGEPQRREEKRREDIEKSNTNPGGFLHKELIRLHSEFYSEVSGGVKYKFNGGADGKGAKEIITYLKLATTEKLKRDPTDQEILNGFIYILSAYKRWTDFQKGQIKLHQISSNLPNIILSIRQGHGRLTSKVQQRADLINSYGKTPDSKGGPAGQ